MTTASFLEDDYQFTVPAADEGETADTDKWEESYDAGDTYVTACQPYEES